MSKSKSVAFTPSGTKRLAQMTEDLQFKIMFELTRRNDIPGSTSVEITAAAVQELDDNMGLVFFDLETQRSSFRYMLITSYIVAGITLILAGMAYPMLPYLLDNPIPSTFIISGLIMFIGASLLRYNMMRKDAVRRSIDQRLRQDIGDDMASRPR